MISVLKVSTIIIFTITDLAAISVITSILTEKNVVILYVPCKIFHIEHKSSKPYVNPDQPIPD